jgi:uracil DNA glycosylase
LFFCTSWNQTTPSLVNIFKELNSDLGIPFPSHGNLQSWAAQGVLLLNATLTVRANKPLPTPEKVGKFSQIM